MTVLRASKKLSATLHSSGMYAKTTSPTTNGPVKTQNHRLRFCGPSRRASTDQLFLTARRNSDLTVATAEATCFDGSVSVCRPSNSLSTAALEYLP